MAPTLPLVRGLIAAAAAGAAALAGCVVVPRTTETYDPQCQRQARQVTLEVQVVAHIGHCHGDQCLAMLASAGIIAVASAVVSGSVAIVGNIAYWIERQGPCPSPSAPPASPTPSAFTPPAVPAPARADPTA